MDKIVQYIITGYLILLNIIGFVLMGIDKNKAIKRKWRIPERTLLMTAIIGGGIGAFLGMYSFHHKTKHAKFVVILPISAIIYLILILKLYHVI